MKKIALISAIGLVSLAASAGEDDLKFDRSLELSTDRLSGLEVDAGSGSMEVVGTTGNQIRVYATITSDDYKNMEDFEDAFEEKMVFDLKRDSGYALLKAKQKKNNLSWGNKNIAINLEIEVPRNMDLIIDDGSGSIIVENIDGELKIDDGSGSITLRDIGNEVQIDDGSGSIKIADIDGDVSIDDGSGSVEMKNINGSVDIEDGSGEIVAKAIAGDFRVDDGSGDVIVKDLEGEFNLVDDGSGSIKVNGEKWSKR